MNLKMNSQIHIEIVTLIFREQRTCESGVPFEETARFHEFHELI